MHAFLSVFGPPRNLQPHYNLAPTDSVDVIRLAKEGKRELVPMRWGVIPASWKKAKNGPVGKAPSSYTSSPRPTVRP